MQVRTLREITESLKAEGIAFRTFELVSEGEYTVDDADWNYKDAPHLTYVHKQVDGYPTLSEHTHGAGIIFQNIPGMRIPLCLLQYESGKNRVTYYTNFMFYLLIIETHYEAVAPLRTRVVTRYAIGCNRWLLRLTFPLIRWLLTRNYRDLMSGDLPMRDRRGELRKWGYGFVKPRETYSFTDSWKIQEQNVVVDENHVLAPTQVPIWGTAEVRFDELDKVGVQLLGRADHLGLKVASHDDHVEVFPRLCPHEGACLDAAERLGSGLTMCPWHGRKFKPILKFRKGGSVGTAAGPMHVFDIREDHMLIACKDPLPDPNIEDWSKPCLLASSQV